MPLVTCFLLSITFETESTYSSETSVDLQTITLRYIPENENLYNHLSENLKSYNTLRYPPIIIILPSTKFKENPFDSYLIATYGLTDTVNEETYFVQILSL
jgi:hypothetical protein